MLASSVLNRESSLRVLRSPLRSCLSLYGCKCLAGLVNPAAVYLAPHGWVMTVIPFQGCFGSDCPSQVCLPVPFKAPAVLTASGAAKVFCLCYEEATSGPSLPDRLTCIIANSICACNLGVSSRLNEGTHTAINVTNS